jgi:GT2 family glycosyltransferase
VSVVHPRELDAGPGTSSGGTTSLPIVAVVLNYRTPEESIIAVRSLLASTRPPAGIIVVDNDSSSSGCRDAVADMLGDTACLSTGHNLGFSGGMNVGIREALTRGAGAVLLVNSDLVVAADCLQHLEACLRSVPVAGIAGPVVLSRSDPRVVMSLGMTYRRLSGRMRHLGCGTLHATLNPAPVSVVDGVSGCLMLVRRDVFETIGMLEESYFFGFEDLDFCLRARRAGFLTVVAGLAVACHEGSRSIGSSSPRRLYFAARNHLLLARRASSSVSLIGRLGRSAAIVLLNLAHAVGRSEGPLGGRLAAVARGTFDYMAGRFGPDQTTGPQTDVSSCARRD